MSPTELEEELQLLASELVDVQDRLLALYELAGLLAGHLEEEPLLSTVVHEAVRLVGASGGFATLFAEDRAPLLVVSPGLTLEPAAALEMARMCPEGDEPAEHGVHGVGRVLLVRLPLRGGRTPMLALVRAAGGFAMPERKLATAIAAQAGSHLEGVLLHQETLQRTRLELEFELARTVQAGLSPSLPGGHPSLDVYAESRAAYVVGGDFFDFATGADGGLVCVLGDVAGKGIPAALLVAMTRANLRAAVREVPTAAAGSVLRRANTDLYHDFSQLGLFATVCVVGFDSAARTLVLANAGHSPVIHRPAGGAARLVKAEAPPIGVVADERWGETTLSLGPGDVLVIATDGFAEAEDPRTGELYGYDRLLALVDDLPDCTAAEIAATLYRVTDEFGAGAAHADDRTALVLRGVER